MEELSKVEIYTDGSSLSESKTGGIGCIIKYEDKILELSDRVENTTSNQMELRAVIEGLKLLKKSCKVKLYSDSAYVVESVRHNKIFEWRKNNFRTVKNKELWQELIKLLRMHSVKFEKVKAHSNERYNERCHHLAYNASINKEQRKKCYYKVKMEEKI